MFCSTIIPTINRPSLSRSVYSVLNQDFDHNNFEIIVVNDSGQPLTDASWQKSPCVRVIDTNQRNRSIARNAGAAIARGKYLHFLDDDDWMLPGAFECLWQLANSSQAALLYGGYEVVDSWGNLLKECLPNESGNCFIRFMAGEWLPLQASLIDSKVFFSIGGFASLKSLLGGDEDVDLTRMITLCNNVAGTQNLVAAIRVGLDSSTTNYTNLHEQSLQSREKALAMPGAFARLRNSASTRRNNISYWRGRITWTYFTSVVWNLQHRKLFTTISRGVYMITSLLLAGSHILSKGFWHGVTRPHVARGWLSSEVLDS